MSDFLPARKDHQVPSLRDFVTQHDGESRCYSCSKVHPGGKKDRCDAIYDHILLRVCQKIEGGAIIPVRNWEGKFTDVRVRRNTLTRVTWTPENEKVGGIIQNDQFYEILEFQPETECGHRDLTWNKQAQYEEEQQVLRIRELIENDAIILTRENSREVIHLVNHYRDLFSKDQLGKLLVLQTAHNTASIAVLNSAVEELASRVMGAGNSLLGRF